MLAIGSRLTRATALIATVITSGAVTLLAAPAAHAAVSSTTCAGSSVITYQPGLTNTAQTVTYTETDTFSPCLSTVPTLTSGTSSVTISLPGASCLALPSLTTNTPYEIDWNNGASSDINLSFTDAVAEGIEQVTGAGTVTSGQFAGATVVIVWVYVVPDPLQCATPRGVTTQVGTITAEITGA
jgi:methionine-rich copper-binding protein CopC